MANKVYTRKGDYGKTSILGYTGKVSKTDHRVKCCGSLDELNTFVGMLICNIKTHKSILDFSSDPNVDILSIVQNDLFCIGTVISSISNDNKKNKYKKFYIDQNQIDALELVIDTMSEKLNPLNNFILPSGNGVINSAHICRAVCRRSETDMVKMLCKIGYLHKLENDCILKYINRLSDYFFVLARYLSMKFNEKETPWVKISSEEKSKIMSSLSKKL